MAKGCRMTLILFNNCLHLLATSVQLAEYDTQHESSWNGSHMTYKNYNRLAIYPQVSSPCPSIKMSIVTGFIVYLWSYQLMEYLRGILPLYITVAVCVCWMACV